MTLIIAWMLLWGLFPSESEGVKIGLSIFLFFVWGVRNAIKGE